MATTLHAPHKHIATTTEKERFTLRLFDDLWARYRERVSYVQVYERVIVECGATFVNDHIAFRTIALQTPADGVFSLSRIFQALGYAPQACYEFKDKHLASIHLAHPNREFPKLFVSELKMWELSEKSRDIIRRTLRSHRPPLADGVLSALDRVDENSARDNARLLKLLLKFFSDLPWDAPRGSDVLTLDKETQFGAWVLLNGYDVNHFTVSVNSHGVPALDDIDKTIESLKSAGVPMKKEIEGERGSILRQSSTESVTLPFRVYGKIKKEKMMWPYAYFEIAERGYTTNPKTGERERFEGFLGAQATHLFEMTRRR